MLRAPAEPARLAVAGELDAVPRPPHLAHREPARDLPLLGIEPGVVEAELRRLGQASSSASASIPRRRLVPLALAAVERKVAGSKTSTISSLEPRAEAAEAERRGRRSRHRIPACHSSDRSGLQRRIAGERAGEEAEQVVEARLGDPFGIAADQAPVRRPASPSLPARSVVESRKGAEAVVAHRQVGGHAMLHIGPPFGHGGDRGSRERSWSVAPKKHLVARPEILGLMLDGEGQLVAAQGPLHQLAADR